MLSQHSVLEIALNLPEESYVEYEGSILRVSPMALTMAGWSIQLLLPLLCMQSELEVLRQKHSSLKAEHEVAQQVDLVLG